MLKNAHLNNINFFIISSEELNSITSKLYGFAIFNDKIYINGSVGSIPVDADGTYINIFKSYEDIIIQQDYNGGYGLYFFQNESFFAFSNSFLYLADYLKSRACITVNTDFARYFITEGLSSISVSETLINEIVLLPKDTQVNINIRSKEVSLRETSRNLKKIDLNSKEGINILDKWYEKWQGLLINLQKMEQEITVDLTGGIDSRATFSIFNSKFIDLNKLRVHSSTGQLHTHKEDFEIATSIASKFNFELNRPLNSAEVPQCSDTTISNSFLTKLGVHKRMYYKDSYSLKRVFYFTGFGGESVRINWKDSESFLKNKLKKNNFSTVDFRDSIRKIVLTSIEEVRERYICKNDSDLMNSYYRDSWSRSHFGKNTVEKFLGNNICLNPLMDKELQKIHSGDDRLLSLIYERYLNELDGIRFDSNKSLSSSSIIEAKIINKKFPYSKKNNYAENLSIIDSTKFSPDKIQECTTYNPENYMVELLHSKKVEDIIKNFLGNEVYQKGIKDWSSNSFVKDRLACALLAIAVAKDYSGSYRNFPSKNSHDNSDNLSSLNILDVFKLARIDIKNIGDASNDVVFDKHECDFNINSPEWFRKNNDGIGYVIENLNLNLGFSLTCVNDGELKISLRGIDIKDENNERIQSWIDFVSCKVDGVEKIPKTKSVWHDKPCHIAFHVKNGQVIRLKFEWLPHAYKGTDFIEVMNKLLVSEAFNKINI